MPSNEERQKMGEDELRKLKDGEIMNDSSLCRYLEMDNERYRDMLLKCNLFAMKGNGIIVKPERWRQLFIHHKIEAEFEPAAPMGLKRSWYLRIGKKQMSYHTNVHLQAKYCEFRPPRCNGIDLIRRALKEGLRRLMPTPTQDELDELKPAAATTNNDDSCNNNNHNNNTAEAMDDTEDNDNDNANSKNYPLLKKLHVNIDKLEKDKNYVQRLLGEIITIQQRQHLDGNKAKVQFIRLQQNKPETAVAVRSHQSDDAFERYQRYIPYMETFISSMDKNAEVAVKRVVKHLGKNYSELFVSAAKETGLVACGMMNEIDCGALISEAGLLDSQWKIVTRHLRYNFNAPSMFVPFQRVKSECCQGVTKPRTKVIEHRRDGREAEIVAAEYQSVKEEVKKCVERLLIRHSIRSRGKIGDAMCVVGGDHGQGAFRLCTNVLLKIGESQDPINEAVSIGKVFCSKEEGELLDATIMPWLSADLKDMNESMLLVRMSEDKTKYVAEWCHLSEVEEKINEDKDAVPIDIKQKLAGDCAWQSFCNGKTNMSPHWCIYCPLHRSQFSTHAGPTENWTIESLTAMADDRSKKGTARLGVTNRPYFPWIAIEDRILPVLHLLIGVGNDVIIYFGHIVEWELIEIPAEERAWKDEAKKLKTDIETYRQQCQEWDETPYRGTTKKSRRSSLMTLRRTRSELANGGNRLNAEEQAEFDLLDREFKESRKKRDDAKARRADLLKKIADAAKGRRRPPKEVQVTWYLLMEKIYRLFNVVREDYHKRQFAGRPMREIMKNAQAIFNAAKTMLRQFKRQDVDDIDAQIDQLCDNVIDVLRTWDRFFSLLHKSSPTDADFDELKQVARDAEQKHRVVRDVSVNYNPDDAPKPHICGAHAHEQVLHHGGCLHKIYEQFVELIHQTESKIEARTKRIQNKEQQANVGANIRAMENNTHVNKKQRIVKEETARGTYKK